MITRPPTSSSRQAVRILSDVAGEKARLQPEATFVAPRDHFIEVLIGHDGNERAEHLLGYHCSVIGRTRDHGRRNGRAVAVTTDGDVGSRRPGRSRPGHHALRRSIVHHGPDVRCRIEGVTDDERGDFGRERVQEVPVSGPMDIDALDRDATLTGVGVTGASTHVSRGGDVSVFADDRRGVAAQLQDETLGTRRSGHCCSRGSAAGETDDINVLQFAKGRTNLAAAMEQLYGLNRGTGLQQKRDKRGRGRRGLRRRLDDRRITCGEGGAKLVGQQIGRSVEWRDGQRHSSRCPVRHGRVTHATSPSRHWQQFAANLARFGGTDRECVPDAVHLAAAVLERLAQLEGDEMGEVLTPVEGYGRGAVEHFGTRSRREASHVALRLLGVLPRDRWVTSLGDSCSTYYLAQVRPNPVR